MGWQTVGHDWAQHSSGTFKVCSQILKTIQFNSYSIWSPYIWLANDNLVAFNWIKFNGHVHYYGNFHILWTPYNPLAQRPHMASWVSFTAEQTSWFPCSLEQIFSLSFPFFHGIFMLFMCESSFSALGLFTFWVEQFFVIRERITAFLVSTSRCQQQPLLMHACSVVSDSLWFLDGSPPGSSVHGISQARTLEWFAISFSRASSRPRDWTYVSLPCLLHCRQILYCWVTGEASTPPYLW